MNPYAQKWLVEKKSDNGFKLVNQFKLPNDVWWKEYFQPLEKMLKQLKRKYKTEDAKKILNKYQSEVDMFKRKPEEQKSAFYIFQRV